MSGRERGREEREQGGGVSARTGSRVPRDELTRHEETVEVELDEAEVREDVLRAAGGESAAGSGRV